MTASPPKLRNCGVLQIEPTDFCNLTCPMCHPQQGFRPNLHGDLLKGYMDTDLFRNIIDGIEASDVCFDHLIFQWLGDPSLHPELFDMLGYALDHVADVRNRCVAAEVRQLYSQLQRQLRSQLHSPAG